MEFALRNDCRDARVSVITANNNSFEYRDKQLDRLQQSSENKLYIELFVDGRYGSFSTNRLDKKELESFIREGIISTRYLAEDPYRQLPDTSRYYKPDDRNLDLYDSTFHNIRDEDKLKIAQQAVDEIYRADERIISISASYNDGVGAEYMIASNGLEVETIDSAFSLDASVSLRTDGEARAESFWYDSTVYWNDLQKEGIGKKALERARQKIGQRKIKSGKYDLILDNTLSSRLLSPMIGALYGSALQQKNSFLIDKLGQQIASDGLTITDKPHMPRTFGARWFDGEGVATSDRPIITQGILQTYFIDTYNSLKMNMAPTIASPSVICMQLGDRDFSEIIKATDRAIWVTGFNGGNSNATTGDFSFGVEGFLIENGVPTTPINEMNVTGNILSLWENLMETGNDPRPNSSWKIPTLHFIDINFNGT